MRAWLACSEGAGARGGGLAASVFRHSRANLSLQVFLLANEINPPPSPMRILAPVSRSNRRSTKRCRLRSTALKAPTRRTGKWPRRSC